jgi:hypothetical protein
MEACNIRFHPPLGPELSAGQHPRKGCQNTQIIGPRLATGQTEVASRWIPSPYRNWEPTPASPPQSRTRRLRASSKPSKGSHMQLAEKLLHHARHRPHTSCIAPPVRSASKDQRWKSPPDQKSRLSYRESRFRRPVTGHRNSPPTAPKNDRSPKHDRSDDKERSVSALATFVYPTSVLAIGFCLLYYPDCPVKRLWVPFTVRASWAFGRFAAQQVYRWVSSTPEPGCQSSRQVMPLVAAHY